MLRSLTTRFGLHPVPAGTATDAAAPWWHQVTDRASAVFRRLCMTVRIEVHEGEDLIQALDRFTQLVQREHRRPWTKRRFGYFEKPSALRRKRRKMRTLRA